MLPNVRSILCAVILVFSANLLFAQDISGPFKKRLYDADILFEEGSYLRALAVYDSLWDVRSGDVYLQYKTGASMVFQSTGREKAYDILKDLRGSTDYPDATFYMARAKHFLYQFNDAINLYNEYLEKSKVSGLRRIETLRLIENCKNGIELMERKMALTLEILTPPSNPQNSQYSPVIDPDGEHLYYTNRGPDSKGELMNDQTKKTFVGSYYEDIFVADHEGGDDQFNFGEGRSISDKINTSDRHEASMSLSYDKKWMYIYLSGDNAEEDIYVSENLGDTAWSAPQKIKGGVNTPHYEGHAFLAPDNRTLYFSSDKPGGLGGRDIYTAILREDGSYGNISNLGPKINTEFNEDSPFMYSNGSSFYFASESHGSMGGYDMFYVKYDSAAKDWQEVINLGYPINTTDDDRFYYITKDGDWGYFSSARASGENLHDIYRIQPGTFERLNVLVLLVGTVYIDDIPSSAIAKIMDFKTGDVLATLVADSVTGEFVYSLLPGHKYKISLLADGFPPKVEIVDVPPMKEGVLRIEHRFDFYTNGYVSGKGIQKQLDSLAIPVEPVDAVCDVDPDREDLTDEEIASGCYFRVQVGAYRNPGNFKYDFLRSVGEVEIKGYDDGITRFLMGPKFTKRSEADKLRMKCIAAGEWDAWITVRR
jgi:Tol biopolymer transport system component